MPSCARALAVGAADGSWWALGLGARPRRRCSLWLCVRRRLSEERQLDWRAHRHGKRSGRLIGGGALAPH
eukprot:16429816-Heterocapsa_arctica.AAC.1